MKTLFTLFFFCIACASFSQTEKINQLDASGKKDGKWTVYLNALGEPIKDSTAAVYCRYTYYDHGTNIYPMGGFIKKNGKIASAGKTKLLDGEYKCLDEKGKVLFIHVFKNGDYVSYKAFSATGELLTWFDYTKHCDGQEHSWYVYTYDKKGNKTAEQCVKKNEKGKWPNMAG